MARWLGRGSNVATQGAAEWEEAINEASQRKKVRLWLVRQSGRGWWRNWGATRKWGPIWRYLRGHRRAVSVHRAGQLDIFYIWCTTTLFNWSSLYGFPDHSPRLRARRWRWTVYMGSDQIKIRHSSVHTHKSRQGLDKSTSRHNFPCASNFAISWC